ncbi:MAG: hypothetical protein Pars2KO_26770 [Parasphingorhabdus sp.]
MRIFAAIGIALLLASCASGGGRPTDRERFQRIAGKPVANPSEVVKAELAFARLAREEGQWTAFRETATEDAVMFVPNLSNAQQWLKGKSDPKEAVDWQPHKITMSCDGSMAVSTGAWQAANGTTGKFYTIWQKQNAEDRRVRGKEAEWKWVFDHGFAVKEPLEEPDFVETKVASCDPVRVIGIPPKFIGATRKIGESRDKSLQWRATQKADKSRSLTIHSWDGNKFDTVIKEDFGVATE